MKVIVTAEYVMNIWRNVSVRKCPPNYKTQEGEYICELEDYTKDDIEEYFEKPQIWGRRHEDPEKEQYISLMHNEDEEMHE
jgi:hypothetical protein